ncbi:MAG: hypothetical protein EOO01_06880 [Chitinophagaceae bacterium]|nr:MAG: hypothetical protein EOO01_06880 [Chitinophagaceae bacterium]
MNVKQLLILLVTGFVLSCDNMEAGQPAGDSDTGNRISSKDTSNNMQSTEIDQLVQAASRSGRPEDLSSLWKATLNLPQWHFITKVQDSTADRKPFIGVIENKPWVFVFTDRNKAQLYGAAPPNTGFVDSSGSVLVISMETNKAIDYVMGLHQAGVYGIRLNEGNGWYAPLEQLPAIIQFVNK